MLCRLYLICCRVSTAVAKQASLVLAKTCPLKSIDYILLTVSLLIIFSWMTESFTCFVSPNTEIETGQNFLENKMTFNSTFNRPPWHGASISYYCIYRGHTKHLHAYEILNIENVMFFACIIPHKDVFCIISKIIVTPVLFFYAGYNFLYY